jgi:hypothetical protein
LRETKRELSSTSQREESLRVNQDLPKINPDFGRGEPAHNHQIAIGPISTSRKQGRTRSLT